MRLDANQQAFLALVRAGLWERSVQLSPYGEMDLGAVYRLAEEQAVLGLVAAGLEHVSDVVLPKEEVLVFVGSVLPLEQRNADMNRFIGEMVEKMRETGIFAVLVKGQGVAQCYERPLWRACGDVDLLLGEDNYNKAIQLLSPLASRVEEENPYNRHLAMDIDSWLVELHGTLRGHLWKRIDMGIDEVQNDVFRKGRVRSWMHGDTQVTLPGVDEDVVFVFAHIIQHYFKEGVGLRQICDWCRLLWTYRNELDLVLLNKRLRKMGVMSEWKAFAALAVDYLGMPIEAMPFNSDTRNWRRKADRIVSFIFETGAFGHNRDYSYYTKYPYVVYKMISLWRHVKDLFRYFFIFPLDSMRRGWQMMVTGISVVAQGK